MVRAAVALILLGCGGHAAGTAPVGSGGGPPVSGANSGATSIDVDARGFPFLAPQTMAPPVEGDGRLPDLPETAVGSTPNGWDTCSGTPYLVTGNNAGCRDCPTAQRGNDYLVAGSNEGSASRPDAAEASPQAYYYFGEAEQAKALWFEVFWINGSSAGTTFTVWRANEVCEPLGSGATYNAEHLLMTPGRWSTGCVPLSSLGAISGLAFRWDTEGVLGFDALRFGDACPQL